MLVDTAKVYEKSRAAVSVFWLFKDFSDIAVVLCIQYTIFLSIISGQSMCAKDESWVYGIFAAICSLPVNIVQRQ